MCCLNSARVSLWNIETLCAITFSMTNARRIEVALFFDKNHMKCRYDVVFCVMYIELLPACKPAVAAILNSYSLMGLQPNNMKYNIRLAQLAPACWSVQKKKHLYSLLNLWNLYITYKYVFEYVHSICERDTCRKRYMNLSTFLYNNKKKHQLYCFTRVGILTLVVISYSSIGI